MSRLNKVYFIGAGSTISLGMPTTDKQVDKIKEKLFDVNVDSEDKELSEFLKAFFDKETFSLQDCYNFIDFLLESKRTIKPNIVNAKEYNYQDITKIRYLLTEFIIKLFKESISIREKNKVDKLVNFYYKLGKIELENRKSMKYADRNEISANYSIVNTNWDLYSVIPMMQAHEMLNHEGDNYYTDKNGDVYQLRLYSSLSNVYATAYINTNGETSSCFPYTPHMAHIFNDDKLKAKRKFIVVDTFFPHGLTNMFCCPVCKKVSLNLNYEDNLENNYNIEKDVNRIFECPYCGYNSIKAENRTMLMQTNFKHYDNFFGQVEDDMLLKLSKSNEVVFIGYCLPPDDVDYLAKLRVAVKSGHIEKVKIVELDKNFNENKFVAYKELDQSKISSDIKEKLSRFVNIFGQEKLFVNLYGAPDCFECKELYD